MTYEFKDIEVEQLRNLCDDIKSKIESSIIALSTINDGKIVFILSVADNLVSQGYNAGKMLKESAKIAGGGGGGKPNLAQAGAKDRSKIKDVFSKIEELIGGQ